MMRTYEVEGTTICVPQEPTFDHDDFATGGEDYVATGYAQSEPETLPTWRLFWHGSGGGISRREPEADAKPYKAVEISTGRVVQL